MLLSVVLARYMLGPLSRRGKRGRKRGKVHTDPSSSSDDDPAAVVTISEVEEQRGEKEEQLSLGQPFKGEGDKEGSKAKRGSSGQSRKNVENVKGVEEKELHMDQDSTQAPSPSAAPRSSSILTVRAKEPREEMPVDPMKGAAALTAEMRSILLEQGDVQLCAQLLTIAAKYEAIVASQMATMCRLEGRLMERGSPYPGHTEEARPGIRMPDPQTAPSQRQVGQLAPKPTYAVVLTNAGSNGVSTSSEVKDKLLCAAAQMTDWIRVKGVRRLAEGKVAVVTASRADADKIKVAPAIAAAGLVASEPRMAEPRLCVSGVPKATTETVFVEEIVRRNLTGVFPDEDMAKVKVVRRMGGPESDTVVFEAPTSVRSYLLKEGRLYVGWTSLRVREFRDVLQCYGCGGYGHSLKNCSLGGRLCRNCGQAGHLAAVCAGTANCRNCAMRGLPANHRVESAVCPLMQRECARRRSTIVG